MTAYADCPDARFIIEWRTAREYETMPDAMRRGLSYYFATRHGIEYSPDEMALYYYTLFYAMVSGDL